MEIFVDVRGFEGLYQVSNLGNVKNVKRDRLRKVDVDIDGYLKIRLAKDSEYSKRAVHRLVAEAFVPNPENKPQVNHIDGNKLNCLPENLEWVTQHENMQHAYRTGLATAKSKFKPVHMIDKETGEVLQTFESVTQASEAVGQKEVGNIISCCKGRRITSGGYKWRYVHE